MSSNRAPTILSCALLLALLLLPRSSAAQRNHGPITDLPICTAQGWRVVQQVVSDGKQGAIIVWYDYRNAPTKMDVYTQRINAAGVPMWAHDGIPICTAPEDQYNVSIVSDGADGAIIAWTDMRDPNGYIYAQRVDGRGKVSWAIDGISIAPSRQGVTPIVASDGNGGALIVWDTFGFGMDVCAQRIDRDGRLLWGEAGLRISDVGGDLHGPRLASDGLGGMIVVWSDERSGGSREFAQHVSADGRVLWQRNGIPLCPIQSVQRRASLVADGSGGAIVIWKDGRGHDAASFGVYGQRIDWRGRLLWDTSGIDLAPAAVARDGFVTMVESARGVIVGWQDARSGDLDIWTQRLDSAGNVIWPMNGVRLVAAPGDQTYLEMAADERQGAIATWADNRPQESGYYTQHVLAAGTIRSGVSGTPIVTGARASTFFGAPAISPDGRGGAYVTWTDMGRFPDTDIYAMRLPSEAPFAHCPPRRVESGVLTTQRDDGVTLRFDLSLPGSLSAHVYDVTGRRVRDLSNPSAGQGGYVLAWDGRDDVGTRVRPGVYFVGVRSSEQTFTVRTTILR